MNIICKLFGHKDWNGLKPDCSSGRMDGGLSGYATSIEHKCVICGWFHCERCTKISKLPKKVETYFQALVSHKKRRKK